MRIVIDLQGAQSSGSRNRGIGRYSTSLALGMCRNRGDHEIMLALNGAFAQSVEEIRQEFADLLPQSAIRVFHPLPEVNSLDDRRKAQREASALAWEAFLASLEPDVVHVSSLFEGLSDDAVTSIGAHGYGKHLTAVTLYDLIPLINHERYLANPVIDRWYRKKIDHVSRADLLLSISESSRQEGLEYLGFPEERIVNISTAADPQFQRISLSELEQIALRERHGISRPFIMYTGGIDYRKNIEGLIEAYALLPETLRSKFALAVVCACQEVDRTRLLELGKQAGLKPGDVVMTGYVAEQDLIGLYSSCSVFVFPSWHEGFGLPALEAMWCGAPVIGSNRSSLPEVIGWEKAMFDPFDSQSIADKLEHVLTDNAFARALIKHGSEHRANFSWDRSARLALGAIERLWLDSTARTVVKPQRKKPRLAYVSPLPPARSGIADYSAELIPELARYYALDLIVPDDFDPSQVEPGLRRNARRIVSVSGFAADHDDYDRVLYHFGNSDHHTHMFGLLTEIPGVVVLHDFFLSGILSYWEHHLKAEHVWSRALYWSHGYQALASMTRSDGLERALWIYPSNRQVLDEAHGIIVHSENSRRLAHQWVGEHISERFALIPHLRVPEKELDAAAARLRLNFAADDILMCSFGIMGATKQNQAILDAWLASEASNDPRVHLVFVGQKDMGEYGKIIDDTITKSDKRDRIHITGWTDKSEFRDYLRAADVAIQLRTLSRGETSGTILDCMNHGLPIIVNANGSMSDIPTDCVIRLDDLFEHEDLVAAIDRLATDSDLRKSLGQHGRRLIETTHDPSHCAALYRDAIEGFALKSKSEPLQVASKISKAFGNKLTELDCRLLAERLDWNAAGYNYDKRILIDISTLYLGSMSGGTERDGILMVLESLVNEERSPRIEPIYWSESDQNFLYARRTMFELLGLPVEIMSDDVVDFRIGDTLFDLRDERRIDSHNQASRDVQRRLGLSYHALMPSPPNVLANRTEMTKEAKIVSNKLKDAGWHPLASN